ncbi:hypothetical protein N657DRAFT_575330 [Parathielavia appendiculata]|uniref:RING-CH-type domain-containing protein n=1 Tax=Parathielavia appendiculata TaxID=2587402 RepID=A0AAN6U063_9PEZI|nr:hypothetical protein N657DRAFT_575330 [Parathielavia appendiculata]
MASQSSRPQWTWPSDEDNDPAASEEQPPAAAASAPATDNTAEPPSAGPTPPRQNQRRYKPRMCRICLEVVHPTTDLDESLAGRVFSSAPRVRYVSEDPESGRLMSPCLCKGSSKYVHEGCLRAWRKASPLSDRNYWRCPTCQFEYRLERLRWGRWLSSGFLRAALTVIIMAVSIFFLGFVADPIINFWVDPFGSLAETMMDLDLDYDGPVLADTEPGSWSAHFVKGFLSLGLLGFLKTMFVMSPWNWFNVRFGTGGRRRRNRMEQINWALVAIGVVTFMGATWKFVNHLMAKTLEMAHDRVVDVQEDGPDEDEEDGGPEPDTAAEESRKDR